MSTCDACAQQARICRTCPHMDFELCRSSRNWSTKHLGACSANASVCLSSLSSVTNLSNESLCWWGPGTLQASWGQDLASLQSLKLNNCSLYGELPDIWAQEMLNLDWLSLQQNSIFGPLPPAWTRAGAFPNLQILNLDSNGIFGQLPGNFTVAEHHHTCLLCMYIKKLVSSAMAATNKCLHPFLVLSTFQPSVQHGSAHPCLKQCRICLECKNAQMNFCQCLEGSVLVSFVLCLSSREVVLAQDILKG